MESLGQKSILVIGGTRQQGPYLVRALLKSGHKVTIANRNTSPDYFGNSVQRLKIDYNDLQTFSETFNNAYYNVVIDTNAYSYELVKRVLDTIKTDQYVMFSSNAAYFPLKYNIQEEDFKPEDFKPEDFKPEDFNLSTGTYTYQLNKRGAEKAAVFSGVPALRIRIPYVCGIEEVGERLGWFVDKIKNGIVMELNKNDYDKRFPVTHTSEAGNFAAFAVDHNLIGAYNIASGGEVTARLIIEYVEKKLEKKANINWGTVNKCQFNTIPDSSMNTSKAQNAGYEFLHINNWLWDTLDLYCYKGK